MRVWVCACLYLYVLMRICPRALVHLFVRAHAHEKGVRKCVCKYAPMGTVNILCILKGHAVQAHIATLQRG
jgi:hypothetical protein